MRSPRRSAFGILRLTSASLVLVTLVGCGIGGLSLLPFASITAVQVFDQPNYTVAFSVESALVDSSVVAKVNWVFGDGSGFVEGDAGRTTITHRYAATGTYSVTAHVFDAAENVVQIYGSVKVVANGGEEPSPSPLPEDLPGLISGPNPADEATSIDVDRELTWTSSVRTDSYDVYLGKDEDAVTNAVRTHDAFITNQEETSYDPEGLDADTEYFWRIDSVNDLGTTKGEVYSFTTAKAPKAASKFQPVDGITTARVDTMLSWTAGKDATSHDIYFGKVFAEVTGATDETDDIFKGNQTATNYDPEDEDADEDGELLASTTYYWRIDEVGPGGTTKGTVLSFTTAAPPADITSPSPANGAIDQDVTTNLGWLAVPAIESFDVYFGIDPVAVQNATKSSDEFKGNQTSKLFDPGDLLGGTTYYWRIDTLGAGGTAHGTMFSFTTAEPPAQVVGPFTPANNATDVSVLTTIEWDIGVGAGITDSFDVYFSTVQSAVTNGLDSAFQGNQDAIQLVFDPGDLLPDTEYFWRIDTVGPGGTTSGTVQRFHTGALPEPVDDPSPADGSEGIELDVVLGWSVALGADTYNVYFGTNQSDINNAGDTDAQFKGSQSGTSFDPMGATDLEGNTQYYWRIDSMSNGGTTKGEVWSFLTAPGKATNPDPLDQDTGLALNAQLSWTAGSGAVSHDVYFGTNMADVENATTATVGIFKGNQASTSFDPETLDGVTTYYWRIDEVGDPADGVTKGDVWTFTTGTGQASTPINPTNGETGVSLTPTLTWNAGVGAVSHDIYFGTSLSSVQDADHADAEYKGNKLLGSESYSPASELTANTMYYWRIDELDGDDNATKGNVWQFKTLTGAATDPSPEDGDVGIDVNVELSWTAGDGATSYDIYFSDVEADVISGAAFIKNTTGLTYSPDTLDGVTTHYWRIDAKGPGGTFEGDVWSFTTGAAQATDPDPTDGQAGIGLLPTLQWTPGTGTTTQDIYFGTSETAASDADRFSAQFQGNVSGGTSSFIPDDSLSGLTFYYWRIDSVTLDGTTKGEVWQFRTGPGKATSPTPSDFAVDQSVDINLTWTAGTGAVTHDVYFSETLADVANGDAAAFQGNQAGTIFDPGTLDPDKTYYWRIDEVSSGGTATTIGTVWRFTTLAAPAKTGSPSPANGAIDQETDTTLSWGSASGATDYDVYFSTNMADVANGDAAAFQGNQATRTFNPGILTAGTTYYWRVDSVNDAGTTIGDVWSFTVEP